MSSASPRLVLASASPRRRDLLQQLGVSEFTIDAADVDETALKDELPRPYALRVARLKAEAKRASYPGAIILSADTVVAVGRRILPKTEDVDSAAACLDLLSGRAHRVYGGIVVISPSGQAAERVIETRVTIAHLSREQRQRYLESGEWRGKAGGYAIQGRFAAHILKISGSYTNVVGLSLVDTDNLLRGNGFQF